MKEMSNYSFLKNSTIFGFLLVLIAYTFTATNILGQTVMSAASKPVSDVVPIRGKLVSSSDYSSYNFYNPFFINNVNSAGDQFVYNALTNTLSFFVQRMGETNSIEKNLYLIFNKVDIDYVKVTRITPYYETYIVKNSEWVNAPDHSIFDLLPSATAGMSKLSQSYDLGISDWAGGVEIEIKFKNRLEDDFMMSIMTVNPNQIKRISEEVFQHFAAPARFLGRILGESRYSDYIAFVNLHFEIKALVEGWQTQGNLYYLSDETGNNNIYLGELSGNKIINIQQLTYYSGNDWVFAYDVCKTTGKILYVVTQDGHRGELYLLETIKSTPKLIPNQPDDRVGPLVKWSPEGNELIFSLGAPRYYTNLQIAKMTIDGSNYEVLITENRPMNRACHKTTILWLDEGMYLGITPQWAAAATDSELWFRDPSGHFTNITNTTKIGEDNAFINPGGTKLVFGTKDNSSRYGIRYMSKSGGIQSEVIRHSNSYYCWPNGWLDEETILYTYRHPNNKESKFDLYLINIDGTTARNISNKPNANIMNAILK